MDGGGERSDVACAAEFGGQASAGAQHGTQGGGSLVGFGHPVEDGVAQYRVELLPERQGAQVGHGDGDAGETRGRPRHHLRADVYAEDIHPGGRELGHMVSGAAPGVQDAFPGGRVEQVEERGAMRGDKRVACIVQFGVPDMRGHTANLPLRLAMRNKYLNN